MDDSPEITRRQQLADGGRYEECIAACDEELQKEPDSAGALSLKGWCLAQLGKKEESLAAYRQAVGFLPIYAPLRKYLGQAYADLERGEEAAEQFDKACKLDPQDAEALLLRGACRLATKELRAGLKDIKDAVAMDAELKDRGEEICRAFAAAHKLDLGL